MRIRPGNSTINILSENQGNSSLVLLAELVDSSMGYEKPILVRNSRELLIWFGDDFKDYSYLKELLEEDKVSLYLYRRVSTGSSGKSIYNQYFYIPDESPNTHKTLEALPNHTRFDAEENLLRDEVKPETQGDIRLYKVIKSDGANFDSNKKVRYSYYIYDWNSDTFAPYDSLAENKENASLQNRDRLSVGYYQTDGDENKIITYSYYHPGMDYESNGGPEERLVEIEDFNEFQEKVLSGHITRNLVASGKDVTLESLENDRYIPLRDLDENGTECDLPVIVDPVQGDINITYFFSWPAEGNTGIAYDEESIINYDNIYYCLEPKTYGFSVRRKYGLATEDFSNLYGTASIGGMSYGSQNGAGFTYTLGNGLCLPGMNKTFNLDNYSPRYSKGQFMVFREYYNMPKGFTIKPDFLLDQKDIYDYYVDGGEVYRFESKTIGKGSEDIKIEIRWIETYTEKNNIYSITISRYDYQEFFEGPLEIEFGDERLDYKISRESKLVKFKIIPNSEPEEGWPEGEWELKGAQVEETTDSEYSFNLMCKTLEDFPPDFILIPQKINSLSEYRILEWTKTLNCQALITNTSEDWEGNIESKHDPGNRFIYFYNPVEIGGLYRPGYYVFLRNLVSFNKYLPSIVKLSYNFPEDDAEEGTDIDMLYENLETMRSNYLNSNNQFYYYNSYFSGEESITTPLVRFVISKITRELEKNKWKIIGEKATKVSEETLYPILQAIKERFSIIRSIEINSFIVDGISRTVEASITTTLSDIISSDVSFDIILNYSKLNN